MIRHELDDKQTKLGNYNNLDSREPYCKQQGNFKLSDPQVRLPVGNSLGLIPLSGPGASGPCSNISNLSKNFPVVAQGRKWPKKDKKVTERPEMWEARKIGPTFSQVGPNAVGVNPGKCGKGGNHQGNI
jgi:hypothetical protein